MSLLSPKAIWIICNEMFSTVNLRLTINAHLKSGLIKDNFFSNMFLMLQHALNNIKKKHV